MKLTDKELIQELEDRFDQMNDMLNDQKQLVNELEKVNTRLLESEKLKSHFLSNIKNEINNPITSMLGLMRQTIQHPEDVDKNHRHMQMIYKETFVLNTHLQNIFMAAELEAGELIPEFQHVSIKELIQKVIQSFDGIYHNTSRVELTYSGHAEFGTDRMVLKLILENLLSNALKFSEEGEAINVEAHVRDNQLEFLIEDFGVGIDPEHREVIFNRFRQLDTGTTKAFGGHGLGLSVVQSAVELLEGSVFVESEKGRGSKFKVNLPSKEVVEEDNLFGDDFMFDSDSQDATF